MKPSPNVPTRERADRHALRGVEGAASDRAPLLLAPSAARRGAAFAWPRRRGSEIEVVEDLGGLVRHRVECIACSAVPHARLHVSTSTSARTSRPGERALAGSIERISPPRRRERRPDAPRAPDQHDRAAAFLRSLGRPLLAVPGNHDIPRSAAGIMRPRASSSASWETTEPLARGDGLFALSGSTRCGRGATSRAAIGERSSARRAAARGAPPDSLRVVALHHHLIGAPWRSRKQPVARRTTSSLGSSTRAPTDPRRTSIRPR